MFGSVGERFLRWNVCVLYYYAGDVVCLWGRPVVDAFAYPGHALAVVALISSVLTYRQILDLINKMIDERINASKTTSNSSN